MRITEYLIDDAPNSYASQSSWMNALYSASVLDVGNLNLIIILLTMSTKIQNNTRSCPMTCSRSIGIQDPLCLGLQTSEFGALKVIWKVSEQLSKYLQFSRHFKLELNVLSARTLSTSLFTLKCMLTLEQHLMGDR